MNAKAFIGVSILAFVLFIAFRFYLLGQKSKTMNPELGIVDGRLRPCGPKPNCVSGSFSSMDKTTLVNKINKLKNAKVIVINDNYLHAIVISRLFGFVDDLEFYFPIDETKTYYRSASRVGQSDFGQNQKRIDRLIN